MLFSFFCFKNEIVPSGVVLVCIFQDWIYRQLCETSTPIHTQLIPLIDVYINSILTPASKANPEATNQPITEQEILNVFQSSAGVSVCTETAKTFFCGVFFILHMLFWWYLTDCLSIRRQLFSFPNLPEFFVPLSFTECCLTYYRSCLLLQAIHIYLQAFSHWRCRELLDCPSLTCSVASLLLSVSKGRVVEEDGNATPSPPNSLSSITSCPMRRTCWRAPNNWVCTRPFLCAIYHCTLPDFPLCCRLTCFPFLIFSSSASLKYIHCHRLHWRRHCLWDGGNLSGSPLSNCPLSNCRRCSHSGCAVIHPFISWHWM